MNKILSFALAVLFFVLIFFSSAQGDEPQYGGSVVVAVSGDSGQLDAISLRSNADKSVRQEFLDLR